MLVFQDVPQAADLLSATVRRGYVPAELGQVNRTRVPQRDVGVDVHARSLDELGQSLAALAGVADLDEHFVVKQFL